MTIAASWIAAPRKISGKSGPCGEATELLWMEQVGIAVVHKVDPPAATIELVTDRTRTA